MSEDVSAQVRVGCTIILVAALVAAVLNLMVVAQSILSSGMSTLQSGTEQVAIQEFENYNQKKKSGTEVKSALTLYQGRDIAICVNTKSAGSDVYVYGALLDGVTESTDATGQRVYKIPKASMTIATGKTYIASEYKTSTGGIIETSFNTQGTVTTGSDQFILESGRFQSTLIKNDAGSIVGIYFEQI